MIIGSKLRSLVLSCDPWRKDGLNLTNIITKSTSLEATCLKSTSSIAAKALAFGFFLHAKKDLGVKLQDKLVYGHFS